MNDVTAKYGKPDYAVYPDLGYSYSVLAKIVEENELKRQTDLDVAVAFAIMNKDINEADAQPSHLDDGYIVYVVLKDDIPVHVGIHAGKNAGVMRRHNPIRDVKRKYGEGCVFIILEHGLSHRQALQIQQTLGRRFSRHSVLASKQ